VVGERYRVEEVVERDVLAVGYRVHDLKFSATWYLQQIDASSGDLDGFTAHAARLAQLRHPGLAQVVDHWVAAPHAYVVREWVEGESLADRIGRHPQGLPLEQVVDLGSKVLDVLYFLHTGYDPLAFGVLSPRTVWVGEEDETKLVDFGLPAFFSGEGGGGSLEEDIRAAGVLLYTMATGRAPDAEVKPPREVRPEIPKGLSQVILKALHADPARRHHDVGAVKHDLMAVAEEFAPDETPSAGAVASIVEPVAKADTRKGCGAAVLVLALLAALSVFL